MQTPWGRAQQIKTITKGILWVSTASHGGFVISRETLNDMPEPIKSIQPFGNQIGFYEEDCDWALVVLSFPEHFNPEEIFSAYKTALLYHEHKFDVDQFVEQHPVLKSKIKTGSNLLS